MIWVKAILPFMIIIHHISGLGFSGIDTFGRLAYTAMYAFFAMSGYGLVASYLRNSSYLDGFLSKSLRKLFVPYLVALMLFVVYRWIEGIDQIQLLREKGLYSFVPASWYIFVLAYFYVFFFLVFKYIKTNIYIKGLLLCCCVAGYYLLAPNIGVESWRYRPCPAFCVGVAAAIAEPFVRKFVVRWHLLIVLAMCIALYPRLSNVMPIYMAVAFFCFMYSIGNLKEFKVLKFLSGISFEMYIIQYIPMYIFMNDIGVTSTAVMIVATLALDILMAWVMHKGVCMIPRKS